MEYKKGKPLHVKWSLFYVNDKPFSIEGYTKVFKFVTGRGQNVINDYEVNGNTIDWVLPVNMQYASGCFTLVLDLYKGDTKVTTFTKPDAFFLSHCGSTSGYVEVSSYAEPFFSAKDQAEKAAEEVENWIGDNDIIPRFCKAVVDEDGNATYYTNVVRMTKEQYDAIEVKGQQTLYILYKSGEIDEIYLGEGRLSLGKEQVQEAIDTANRAYGAIESVISKAEVAEQAALDAAESAEQVKQKAESINSDINDLKQAVADLPDGQSVSVKVAEHSTKISDLEKNFFDVIGGNAEVDKTIAVKASLTNSGYILYSNGKIIPSSANVFSDFIEIDGYNKLRITFGNTNSSTSIGLAFYSEANEDAYISGVPYGDTSSITFDYEERIIDIPQRAKYFRTSFFSSLISSFYCFFVNESIGIIPILETRVDDLSEQVENLKSDTKVVGGYENVTSNYGTLLMGYINRDNGSFVSYNDCQSTEYIPISELKDRFISGQVKFSVALYGVYNSANNLLTTLNRGSQTSITFDRLIFPYEEIISSYPTAAWVRLSSFGSPLIVEKREIVPINEKVTELDTRVDTLEQAPYLNVLYGKKVVAIGDSMVQGHTLSDADGQTWLAKIAERNNMTRVNYGKNGCSLSYIDRDESPITTNHHKEDSVAGRYSSMDNDADYIIVFAGTNDAMRPTNYPLGNIDDTDKGTSFCGSLNDICNGLITKYPTKKICFFTPYNRNTTTLLYVEAIEKVCAKYSIPVFNNTKLGGICFANSTQSSTLTMGDATHLNEDGMEYASRKYEAFLRTL